MVYSYERMIPGNFRHEENGQSQSQSQSQITVKRKGVVYTICTFYGEKGHNKRYHNIKKSTQTAGISMNANEVTKN